MRKLQTLLVVAFVAAIVAPAAGARVQVGSGDSCTYSGSGTTYTVSINAGAGVREYGVAIGAPGARITNIGLSGQSGNFASTNLPAKTTGGWLSDTPLSGNLSASLTIMGSPTGAFVIIPVAAQGSYFSPVTCSLHVNPAKPAVTIKIDGTKYSSQARAWHLMVKVPIAGTLSAVEPLSTNITPVLLLQKKSLVQTHSIGTKTGGLITLTLRPTSSGSTMLAAKGTIKVTLRVTFDAADGHSAHKTVALTLRR